MRFIIYCRKSTDTEDKQVLSLESQEAELLNIARKENLNVVKKFRESMSAKEPGRPFFNEALKLISQGKADAILCWKIDRLTRNPIDGGQVQWMLQTDKIKCIKTFEKSYYPNDNVLLINIEQAMATQYIRDLSVNVKRGNRAKLEKGEWPSHAPLGYINDKGSKTIIVDDKKSRYIKRAFEIYASGGKTLQEVADIIYKEGLRSRTGNKISKGQIHKFIMNKFYYGVMERDGRMYKGNHTPIISLELFTEAQNVLHGRLHPRPKKHFYSARGFIQCAECGCGITADTKRGHQYYYCTNGKQSCNQHKRYYRSEKIHEIISELFDKLKLPPQLIIISGKAYEEIFQKSKVNKKEIIVTLQNEAKMLLDKENMLVEGFTSKIIRYDVYTSKIKEIEARSIEIELQISALQNVHENNEATFEQIKNVLVDGYFASYVYKSASERIKRSYLEKRLSNIAIKDGKIVSYQFKSPYNILAKVPQDVDFSTMLAVWDDIRESLIINDSIPVIDIEEKQLREAG